MALLDFLKNKKEAERAQKKPVKKVEKVLDAKKSAEQPDKSAPRNLTGKTKSHAFSFEAIKEPHISEKGSYLAEKDQYIFRVSPNYNKNEVKKAVEGVYGVTVLSVNMIKIPPKKRRLGKTEGFRKAYVKAVVKIKNGEKIEIL